MKTFFALGALALFHTAYALVPGPYTIGSGILDSSQVLTYVARDHSLIFSDNHHNVGQTWFFYPTHDGYFEIRNELGYPLNCPGREKSACFVGDRPQGFLPEFLGGESYELVAEGSGLFVRVDDNRIYLDLFDQSLNEQFILTEAEQ
jgi:hypothetical protein